MTRESVARKLGMTVVARVAAHAAHAHEPGLFTTAPVPAIQKCLTGARLVGRRDVDLFEVNEAFAVVAMIAERDLGIDRAKLNVNGGACALGHPIGASGARILATLLSALEARGGKRGVASLCIGGGEATAMAVELARAASALKGANPGDASAVGPGSPRRQTRRGEPVHRRRRSHGDGGRAGLGAGPQMPLIPANAGTQIS